MEGGVQAKGVVVQVLADLPARLGMVPLPAEAEEGEKAAAAAQEPAVLFSSPGGKRIGLEQCQVTEQAGEHGVAQGVEHLLQQVDAAYKILVGGVILPSGKPLCILFREELKGGQQDVCGHHGLEGVDVPDGVPAGPEVDGVVLLDLFRGETGSHPEPFAVHGDPALAFQHGEGLLHRTDGDMELVGQIPNGGKGFPMGHHPTLDHHKEILINPLIQTDIFFHGCSNPLPHSCRSGRRAGDHRVIAGNRGRCPLYGGKVELLPPKCSKDSPLCMGAVFARV